MTNNVRHEVEVVTGGTRRVLASFAHYDPFAMQRRQSQRVPIVVPSYEEMELRRAHEAATGVPVNNRSATVDELRLLYP
jgi:hypothetical protein